MSDGGDASSSAVRYILRLYHVAAGDEDGDSDGNREEENESTNENSTPAPAEEEERRRARAPGAENMVETYRRATASAASGYSGGGGMEPVHRRDYGHVYWRNGWMKNNAIDDTPDILCFETGYFGLTIDVDDLTTVGYGKFDDVATSAEGEGDEGGHVSYEDAVDMSRRTRMDGLGGESLSVMVTLGEEDGGKSYRLTTCKAGTENNRAFANLWEAGRFVQNYNLLGAVLKSEGAAGENEEEEEELQCKGTLRIVVWPKAVSFTLTLSPANGDDDNGKTDGDDTKASWKDGATVDMQFLEWSATETFAGPWDADTDNFLSLVCDVTAEPVPKDVDNGSLVTVRASGYKRPTLPVTYDPAMNCLVVQSTDTPRTFPGGYRDIRDYDEFYLVVQNDGRDDARVPLLLHMLGGPQNVANITGLVVLVCQADGTPTGIPAQLSKNWHDGVYVKSFMLLPATGQSTQIYRLQIVYGFYGAIPSASHSNLSLLGLGGRAMGRWEQLAIGCWGETLCLNPELCATDKAITDVRALMLRRGRSGQKWKWCSGGWGGDWLYAFDAEKRRVLLRGVKVAYACQGPCLTEVRYGGYYGAAGGIVTAAFDHVVRTLRTDDYARTFFSLTLDLRDKLVFDNVLNAKGCGLFRLGQGVAEKIFIPKIVVGNAGGTLQEFDTKGKEPGTFLVEKMTLTGPGPWWVACPGMRLMGWSKAHGTRALVIQKYAVTRRGRTYAHPSVSLFVAGKHPDNDYPAIDLLVDLPKSAGQVLERGSRVAIELYSMVVPHVADDYYGPNEALRKHMEEHPDSWETVRREAKGNDLKVEVTAGAAEVKKAYPLLIEAATSPDGGGGASSEIRLEITGGIGAVPVRFDGLESPEYRLLRAVPPSGEGGEESLVPADDSFQVTYDAETFTYSVAYNILLDRWDSSTWVLKKRY